jgi:hypothetical protein
VRLQRIKGDVQAPAIDPVAAKIGAVLDELDGAIGFIGGIRESRERESRLLASSISAPAFDPRGTFEVVKPFRASDGLEFPVGSLIDSSLVPVGHLRRLLVARTVRLYASGGRNEECAGLVPAVAQSHVA